ncbi:anthrone oxygenase family protein [uncultured Amnibacterium sp.]|uniref:anthrone oxygenase family protein n=1 Tax=uncultured Amnibacterium sp. TaxID=1631851 RepID=UPI0035CA5E89
MPNRSLLHYVALLTSALSTGVLFGTWASLGPSVRTFSPRTYVDVQQATVRNLRPVMGPLLPTAVVSTLAASALPRGDDRAATVLQLAGFTGQLAALVLTAAVELPINARVLTWSPDDPPEGWQRTRDRWARTHTVRTATSVLGLGASLAAALLRSPPSR